MAHTLGLAKNAAGQVEGFEIFIKFLPPSASAASLKEFFGEVRPEVGEPRIMLDSKTGNCKGIAWITFASKDAFQTAISWTGSSFQGRKLEIKAGKQFHTGIRPSVQAPGTHTPALCAEVVKKLVAPNPGGVYVDGTFGRGGHTRAMLAAMSPSGSLHAFDMDPEAIVAGKELMKADSRFIIHHAPFSSMKAVLKPLGVRVSAVLFDLGISSPQFDDAGRGFRPEADGPLDLRFDQTKGITAWDFLMSASREEIIRVISEYGEISDATASQRIADVICLARSKGALPKRTREFATLVAKGKGPEYQAMHPAKLTFQALRIHLNSEFDEMRKGISAAFGLLGEGGRIGLISWKHSECAIIMDIFRSLEAVRDKEPLLKWYRTLPDAEQLPERWSMEMDEVTRPSEKELQTNSRSRSALLHVLRKRRMPRLADLESLAYALPAWCSVTEPAVSSTPARKRKRNETEATSVAAPAGTPELTSSELSRPSRCEEEGHRLSDSTNLEGCNHCGKVGHTTKRCTFGAKPSERFLPCEGTRPKAPCFWRRFLLPLQRANAQTFTADDPRACGRADVGLRCVSAALFRSQGLRRNTQVCLSFEASNHTLEVSGALARGLVPDEPRLASRVFEAFESFFAGRGLPDPDEDPEAWCASNLRGLEVKERSTKAALKAALKKKPSEPAEGRVVMLMLDAEGEPIVEVLKQISRTNVVGIVAVLGDHRGFGPHDVQAYEEVARSMQADIVRTSLGGTTLLGSHAIVILQHYLDEHLHRCEVPKQVDYGRGR
ncbi:rsmH [Symbiodinium microadriaticum]|nr:rsmH [Symbiodinium microadriaticum]